MITLQLDGRNCNYIQNILIWETGIVAKSGASIYNVTISYTPFNVSLIVWRFGLISISTQLKKLVDSVIWDFGDGATSTDLETSLIYQNTGDTVSLTK
jgi:hypothetical protein